LVFEYNKILRDVPPEKAFWFNNGTVIRNIYELSRELNHISDYDFQYHCNTDHDDFANWIGGALLDISLSQKLRSIKNKKDYIRAINRRIFYLEKYYSLHKQYSYAKSILECFFNSKVVRGIIFILVILLLFFLSITGQLRSQKMIMDLNEKLSYLEERNACFNNYFSEQLNIKKDGSENTYAFDYDMCIYNYTVNMMNPLFEETPEYISRNDVAVYDNKTVINISGIFWSVFANTSSMLPVLNHNSKAIEIKPKISDLNIGDIISYVDSGNIIVHRIIDVGYDDEGFYAITKGDNNPVHDQKKVRFNQVQGKIVMIIY
jgi:signal peptidase I